MQEKIGKNKSVGAAARLERGGKEGAEQAQAHRHRLAAFPPLRLSHPVSVLFALCLSLASLLLARQLRRVDLGPDDGPLASLRFVLLPLPRRHQPGRRGADAAGGPPRCRRCHAGQEGKRRRRGDEQRRVHRVRRHVSRERATHRHTHGTYGTHAKQSEPHTHMAIRWSSSRRRAHDDTAPRCDHTTVHQRRRHRHASSDAPVSPDPARAASEIDSASPIARNHRPADAAVHHSDARPARASRDQDTPIYTSHTFLYT